MRAEQQAAARRARKSVKDISVGPRAFVAALFMALGSVFVGSAYSLWQEFRHSDWETLLFTSSNLFYFFPVFGVAALFSFYVPAVVLTDLYWRVLRAGPLRYAAGFVVIAAISAQLASTYATEFRRGIWQVAPHALDRDRQLGPAGVANCTMPGGGACQRMPALETLQRLRYEAMRRPTITEFARVCVPDELVEEQLMARHERFCFPAAAKMDAVRCCQVQRAFEAHVEGLWRNPDTRSRLSAVEAAATGAKSFFVLVVLVVGFLLLLWRKKLKELYGVQLEAVERGVIVGASLMLIWLLTDYAAQQTQDVLFGRMQRGFPFRLSLVVGLLAVVLIFYFLRRVDGRVFNAAQLSTMIASGVAVFNYELIGNLAARMLGTGADRLIFLSGVIGAIVAVGLVYGPWTMPLPPMRGEAGSRDQAPATGLDRDGGRG